MVNVLVVDDSAVLRQQVREAFEAAHSFQVHIIEADSGLGALEILKTKDII